MSAALGHFTAVGRQFPGDRRQERHSGEVALGHDLLHGGAHLGGGLDNGDAGRLQRVDLVGGSSFAAGYDRARVAHPPARRRRQTCNTNLYH